MQQANDTAAALQDIFAKLNQKRAERGTPEYEHQQRESERQELEAREHRRIEWMNSYYRSQSYHGLPFSTDAADLSTLEGAPQDAEAIALLKAWKGSDEFGFVVIGPAGCGKSFALQALAKNLIFSYKPFSENQMSLVWAPVSLTLDKIRKQMSEDNETTKRSLLRSDYVFFDDLGAENLTDWCREQIYQIFDYRLNNRLPTFISSNCTMEELKARYHERFVSRLKETCIFVPMKGRDRRADVMRSHLQTLKDRIAQSSGATQ